LAVRKHDGEEVVGTALIHCPLYGVAYFLSRMYCMSTVGTVLLVGTALIHCPLYGVAYFLGRMYCMSTVGTVLLVAASVFERNGVLHWDRQQEN
jgi:hypothetical protein